MNAWELWRPSKSNSRSKHASSRLDRRPSKWTQHIDLKHALFPYHLVLEIISVVSRDLWTIHCPCQLIFLEKPSLFALKAFSRWTHDDSCWLNFLELQYPLKFVPSHSYTAKCIWRENSKWRKPLFQSTSANCQIDAWLRPGCILQEHSGFPRWAWPYPPRSCPPQFCSGTQACE